MTGYPEVITRQKLSMTRAISRLLGSFFGCRRHRLFGQRISVLAIHRLQAQDKFAAQIANRSGDISLTAGALAKLAGDLGREFCAHRTGHRLQHLRDFTVREHIEERRLPQGDVERRLERVVEDCIARAVGKICWNSTGLREVMHPRHSLPYMTQNANDTNPNVLSPARIRASVPCGAVMGQWFVRGRTFGH
jgi:hypothetical protein